MEHNTKDANVKCQLLSLKVHRRSRSQQLTTFPEISKHQTKLKGMLLYMLLDNTKLSASHQHRQRINYAQLHHVAFFCDPWFNENSSYPTRNVKLDSGDTLVIPDKGRTMIHLNMIKPYNAYCASNNFEPLSVSTLCNKNIWRKRNLAVTQADAPFSLNKNTQKGFLFDKPSCPNTILCSQFLLFLARVHDKLSFKTIH